jgi:hypothetical protein
MMGMLETSAASGRAEQEKSARLWGWVLVNAVSLVGPARAKTQPQEWALLFKENLCDYVGYSFGSRCWRQSCLPSQEGSGET